MAHGKTPVPNAKPLCYRNGSIQKEKNKPTHVEELDEGGQIKQLTFTNVPAKVMSAIFDAVYSKHEPFNCDCTLRYIIKEGDVYDKYEFGIQIVDCVV